MTSKAEIEKRIATMGDPKSNGAWSRHMAQNKRYEDLKSLVTHGVEHSSTPVSTAPAGSKKQKTDVLNYINKMVDMYEGDHIKVKEATPKQVGQLAERLEENRQRSGEMSTWDSMKATAKTPAEKKEIRDVIRRDYNRNGPKNMAQDDLKWIGKAKSQQPIMDFKIDANGISSSINNYINATRANAPVAPPKKKRDPDLSLGLGSILGESSDS